jgi:hypothetical protein
VPGHCGVFGPVAQNGTFTIAYSGMTTVGGEPATSQIKVAGTISTGGQASGTFRRDIFWTHAGTNYHCTNGDQTWTAANV